MNKEYNSRQRKIYSDHNGYSTESLFEMFKNRNKYIPEVIEVIEDPSGTVLDVFHAVLTAAKEHELITNDDPSNDFEDGKEMEAEKEKYWKCPNCKKIVGMEFGVCWNCQTEIPAVFEHPDTEEIIKEKASQRVYNPIKTGFIIIGCGVLVCLLAFARGYSYSVFKSLYNGRFAFGLFFILVGLFFITYGLFNKPETE